MSLLNLTQLTTVPAASIPDHHTATEADLTYNSTACSSSRPRSMSLALEQATSTFRSASNIDDDDTQESEDDDDSHQGPGIDQITDDMLSIHSTKSESFVTNGNAPALPEKSALRASRLLATLPQKLPQDRPVLTHAAPHLVYLSSEEDASSSADDLSDLDSFDSDSEESLDGHASQAEFARAVSVVFSGKPSVINLSSRSVSLASLRSGSSAHDDSTLRTASTEPTLGRIRSVSVASSLYTSGSHPPRSSSMTSNLDKRRPKFLHVDPMASSGKGDDDSLKTPKTPTAMFSRAFNLVKKRSRPSLNAAYRDSEVVVPMEQVGEEASEEADAIGEEHISPRIKSTGPIKYQDIMQAAKRNARHAEASPPLPAPSSPTTNAKERLRTFSLAKRMSIRV